LNGTLTLLPDEIDIDLGANETLLAAALRAGIGHAHACGGRARCSTCRVRVVSGIDDCLPRNRDEAAMADRFGFDPAVRLACQTRVGGDVVVRRLVLDSEDLELALAQNRADDPSRAVGAEQRLTVMFADLRGFTHFAEHLPPYDVIHVLNRYFAAMSRAVERHGGRINNTMGDGLMALFPGDVASRRDGALEAVAAALAMVAAMDEVKTYVESTYGHVLDIGIGLHLGEVVLGALARAGEGRLTAIGDTINLASRIEQANKQFGTRVLASDAVVEALGDHVVVARSVRARLPGRSEESTLHEVASLS